ncbi:MAG: lysozyme inhibitor LprI family protein [Pseudomonadota bacterium]|nr:lysozyme inhibitor LprI family protein [Pseudomonadota bacterium]
MAARVHRASFLPGLCVVVVVAAAAVLGAALRPAAAWAQAPAPAQVGGPAGPACTPQTCTLQDFEAVRDETETLYGDVLLILSAHERPDLRADQAQWRRSARQHCQQQAPLRGDAAAPGNSAHHACMIAQYQARRRALRQDWLHGSRP